MERYDIGVVGLAVMGENLALNIESRGYSVAVYNRTTSKVTEFIEGRGRNLNFYGALSAEDFCKHLQLPRKIFLMVKAGDAVDGTITSLLPYLSKGDIIIDGGNSNYNDTARRIKELSENGIRYIGSGVSGGEEGALHGPSLMPGGDLSAWKEVKPIFEAISAKVDDGGESFACTTWIGGGGSGHFVKMVHNGIEYGDMQVICEGYDIARKLLCMDNPEIASLFEEWNRGRLSSYLIEITGKILREKDDICGCNNGDYKNSNCQNSVGKMKKSIYLVDNILDTAGQKGTGKWTAITALDEGTPLNLITDSVFSRYISAQKEIRGRLSEIYSKPVAENQLNIDTKDLEAAIFASKLISYAQGFDLITSKSDKEGWNIKPGDVAAIWRGGCIIRSSFLNDITKACNIKSNSQNHNSSNVDNLLFSDFYISVLPDAICSLRRVVAAASLAGVPVSCMSGALSYYDAITSNNLPANLLQAQRDYFGAHTFERIDNERNKFFHHIWSN